MSAGDELLRIFLQELGNVAGQIGVSTGYPHRPISPGLAESVLVGSITGARVAPVVTWFLGEQELNSTIIGPHRIGDVPSVFADGLIGNSPAPWLVAGTPGATDTQNQAAAATAMMGNVTDFTAYMIVNIDDPQKAPNFNLDCDRGYGYKPWDHHGNPAVNPFLFSSQVPVNLDYV